MRDKVTRHKTVSRNHNLFCLWGLAAVTLARPCGLACRLTSAADGQDKAFPRSFGLVKLVSRRVVSEEADTCLGPGSQEVGKEGDYVIYLTLHWHHQNDSCIQMGSDESHFKVSLIVRLRVTKTMLVG